MTTICSFCGGKPVGNVATWTDRFPRGPAPCPRCGETNLPASVSTVTHSNPSNPYDPCMELPIDITGVGEGATAFREAKLSPERERIIRAALVLRQHNIELSPARAIVLAERAAEEGRIVG